MDIQPIFSTGIGKIKVLDYLEVARKIFAENRQLFCDAQTNFRTTLKEYLQNSNNTQTYANVQDVNEIKEVIKKNTLDYLTGCGYETSKVTLSVPNFWLNEMEKKSFHTKHDHYGYSISGCYYVDVPKDSGKIYFFNPITGETCKYLKIKKFTPMNSSNWNFLPEEGDMFFWKSTLSHEVPLVEFEGVRRSIAFDVLITGV